MEESGFGAVMPTGNRSVSRALDILELLAGSERPLGLAEVAKRLDLPKTSALSLLRALLSRSFAALDEEGRYTLGLRSFEVGSVYLQRMTPVRAVETELRVLTVELLVTSHFAILQGNDVVYLAKHDPPQGVVRLASSLGARLPAISTAVGLAQLAHTGLPPEARTARLLEQVEQVRLTGYATDDGGTVHGIQCVAAPVFDAGGCCGAIGISHLQGGQETAVVASAVCNAAQRASAVLGGARVLPDTAT
ncbi:IclR family transcriptional regulator [Streptomyces sp. cg40]|uniref:IclR family transcriptional regulator n=1 Tax=Streptomyces sp. cg40 TaxID=3419764 RepID=UPI003CFD9550